MIKQRGMNVDVISGTVIRILPENDAEAFALKEFLLRCKEGNGPKISVDIGEYLPFGSKYFGDVEQAPLSELPKSIDGVQSIQFFAE